MFAVLVLAPTREIAVQIHDVVVSIGQAMAGLKCHVFIGGLPVHEDKQKLRKCHIAIGSPGRIKQLIELGLLKTSSIRLFVLDEADKLLETGSFQEQINWIYSSLPDNKQMAALSATYPESLAHHLQVYMRDPTFVRLDIQDLSLKGIKQFFSVIPQLSSTSKSFQAKTDQLIKLLSRVPFHQCLVFSNDQGRAQSLCEDLNSKGWPTAYIAGSQEQTQRLNAMSQLRNFQCRVLVSTDLTARGIDAEKVNLVVNLDVPHDWETYMHRIGRAGRFGTQGAAVTLVYSGKEESRLETITHHCRLSLQTLPNPIPSTLITSKDVTSWEVMSSGDQVTVTTISTMPKDRKEQESLESPTNSNVMVHGTHPDTPIADHGLQRLKRTEREGTEAKSNASWEQEEEETIDYDGEGVSEEEWQDSDGEETDDEWEEEDETDETETDEDYSEDDEEYSEEGYDSYNNQQRPFYPNDQENYYYQPDETYSQYPDHNPPPYQEEYPSYGENMTSEFSEQYSSAPYWSVPERTAIGETWCCCGRRDCGRNRWLSTWARAYSSQCLYMAAMLGNRDFR
ncbi:DDX20 [Branchiostoma lanceolatum]|uniref:RNA helicase n=1 Tax=Branchiostoma lanceolatum TaxID=7740 RepID=A0A8K0ERJ3_BRALA|nr:DDX20 [Branchiostoma lanceolatum]